MQCLEIILVLAVSFFVLLFIEEGGRSLIHSMKLILEAEESINQYNSSFSAILNNCVKSSEITFCREGIRSWVLIDETFYES